MFVGMTFNLWQKEEWVDQFPYSSTSWVSEMLALWLVALSKGPSSPHILCICWLDAYLPYHTSLIPGTYKSVVFISFLGAAPDTSPVTK